MKYSEIPNQTDYMEATRDWAEQVYGIDVLLCIPVVVHEVWRFILAGYTEAMTLETIQAMFNLSPL